MGAVSRAEALDYVAVLADLRPGKAPRAAVRWHGRLCAEAPMLTLPDAQLALAALASLCTGEREALGLLSAAAPSQADPPAADALTE